MSPIDRIAHLNRWRHRPLAEKTVLALGMLALTLALPPLPAGPAVAGAMTGLAVLGAGVPAGVWLACLGVPMGFLLTGALPMALSFDGAGLSLAPGGALVAAEVVVRSLAGVSCLLFLALTTPASDLVRGLRRCGLPAEICDVALLTYRFLFLLADTAAAMNAAQAARLGHAGRRRRLRSLGVLIANLLPRALDRARRLETGLAARGWTGEMRVLTAARPVSWPALAAVLALEAAIAGLGWWAA